jgi:hypothetical protein
MALDLNKVAILPRAMQMFRNNSERFNNNLNEFKSYCIDLLYKEDDVKNQNNLITEVIIERATHPDNVLLSSCIIDYDRLNKKAIQTRIYKKEPNKNVNMTFTLIENKYFELKDFDVNILEQKDRFELWDILKKLTEKTFGDTVGSRRVGKIIKGL